MASAASISTGITIDESHQFFLQNAKSSGAILVSQPLVAEENYPNWARSMKRALRIKNKLGFINGAAALTPTVEKMPLVVQSWARCNGMVVSWILNCVSPRIATSIVYRSTAIEVWNNLRERFS